MATISPRARRAAGPDRATVYLLTLAGFLAVLALMASSLRPAPVAPRRPVVLVRRIYETRVVETVVGPGRRSASASQSVSSSGPATVAAASPAPTTRAS